MGATRVVCRIGAIASVVVLAASAARGFEVPDPIAKIFGGGQEKESEAAEPGRAAAPAGPPGVDCPDIFVDSGASSLRTPANADNASVHHQLSLGKLARECTLQGQDIHIKVGVEGAVILGPAGRPGAYSGGLRISVRQQKDESIVQSKLYRVGADVPAGATRGEFRLIADPLVVPNPGVGMSDEYEIFVGFEQGAGERAEAPRKRQRRTRRPAAADAPEN